MLGSSNQSLLTSFISRVAAGPSVTKWTSNFSRMVERCCKATPDKAGPLLVQMEEWLVPNKFENVCTQSQEDLLNLWECSLRISSERVVQQMHREVAFGLILLLMQRDDFSLTQESLEDIRIWYNRLLLATFDRATVLLKFNSKSVGEVQFAATALSVFFFRLPLVSTMVVDALQTKAKETRRDNGFWAPEPSSGLPCSIGASGGPGRRRSSAARLNSPGVRGDVDTNTPTSPPVVDVSNSSPDVESASPGAPSVRKSRLSLRLAEKAALNAESNSNHEGSPKAATKTPPSPPRTPLRTPSKESTIETPTSSLRRLTEEWNDADKRFVDANPDLFLWNASLLDSDHTTLVFNHVLDATPHWAKWLSTKESFFLSFAEMFVNHVQRCANSSQFGNGSQQQQPVNIRWKLVPGYDLLLSCFFPLLRSAIWWDSIAKRTPGQGAGWVTSLQGYMRVKRTACSLLQADRSLLPGFVRCAFECTNLHSLLSVDSGIEHLNLFFASSAVIRTPPVDAYTAAPRGIATTSSSRNESLPESFDYDSFWECFAKLLESESYQVLLKCCSFLYNNLHLFFGRNRTKIVNDLLRPRLFFRLFLHWSPEVRTCFHHLIVYKILRADRRYLPCFSDSQVMLLYGTSGTNGTSRSKSGGKKTPVSSPRVAVSAKAAWGKQDELVLTTSSTPISPTSPPPLTSSQQVQGSVSPPPNNNNNNGGNPQDAPATAEEIAQLTRSAQRRLSLFDRANATDDEELWSDMAFSSKIDSFVRMCLSFRDKDGGGVPKELLVYVEPALEQYSLLLIRYYRGATLASLDEIPDTLSHRMMLSEFTESIG